MKLVRIKSVVILTTGMLSCFSVSAQTTLEQQLESKNTFSEIVETVDNYYDGQSENWRGVEGRDRRLKHWKRWEWYMSGRLGENGAFGNIPEQLIKANEEVNRMEESETRNVNAFWSEQGPVTTDANGIGRADRIAFHPSNPNIFYVGTPAAGLWKTSNGGTTWSPLTDNLPSLGISGVVVNYDNPNEIFILTGDGDSDLIGGLVSQFGYSRPSVGVLRSSNGGATWHTTGLLDTGEYMAFKMIQHPTDADVLLVATSNGIFRTDNGGSSWTQRRAGEFYDIEFLPGTSFAVAAGKNDIVFSLSGGAEWSPSVVHGSLGNPQRIELEVTPDHPTLVYLLSGGTSSTDSMYDSTFKSTNSGLSFDLVHNMPNILGKASAGNDNYDHADYDLAMAVSPIDDQKIVTGAVRMWRSTDGAGTFSYATTQTHADIHDLAYNPLNNKLYACTDGGVYQSLDDGDTWQSLWVGFAAAQFYHMRGTPLNNTSFIGGLQDNGVKTRVAGTYWQHEKGGDGFDVSFFPTDVSKFYMTVNSRLYRWADSLENITPNQDSDGNYEWFGTVVTHISDPNIVFAGYSDVFRSMDNGETWDNLGKTGSWAMTTCPNNANRLYSVGADDWGTGTPQMFRTDNLGDDWETLSNKPGFPTGVSKITDVAVNPSNSDHVYITVGGLVSGKKVYRSIVEGTDWDNWSDNLPNIPINCVTVTGDGSGVYIGTDVGVFYRSTTMSEWMPFRNALPNVPVTDLYIQNNAGKVFAGTFGRGMWSADLVESCPGSLVLTGVSTGYSYFQASNEIRTTNTVGYGVTNQLHLTAGSAVILKPGFVANRTSYFTAAIDGCGSGGIPGG